MEDKNYMAAGQGQITQGIALNTLVDQVLNFVQQSLLSWRDDPDSTLRESENSLNSELCGFLDVHARHNFSMIRFHHQHEDESAHNRSLDFAAKLARGGEFSGTVYGIHAAIVVFEGKRLPAPSKGREFEYVSGISERSGGIQRFKLGVHGAQFETAAIVGYIQQNTPAYWLQEINSWIDDLICGKLLDELEWHDTEKIRDFVENETNNVAASWSVHPRTHPGISTPLRLRHLWIKLKDLDGNHATTP